MQYKHPRVEPRERIPNPRYEPLAVTLLESKKKNFGSFAESPAVSPQKAHENSFYSNPALVK